MQAGSDRVKTSGVYLDQAATTYPKPDQVVEAMVRCMRDVGGNPGRSGHRRSLEAGRIVLDARDAVARLLNARDPSHVVFTCNATDALNMAIKGFVAPGDHVITTSMEHNSVIRPLRSLERSGKINITVVPANHVGRVSPSAILEALRPETSLVVMTHASNVTGTINPVEEIGFMLQKRRARLLVDAAQTAGVLPIDVQAMHADMLAFSGHKGLLGPQGTGCLYVNPDRVALRPWREGGTGSMSHLDTQPGILPDMLEAGTLNTPGIAGLGAAARYIFEQGIANIRAHELSLVGHLREGLTGIRGVTVYGPESPDETTGVVSFTVRGWDCSELAFLLEERYCVVSRPGLHCAPDAHRTIATYPQGTLRFSVGWFNTQAEIDYVIDCLREIILG